MATPTPQDLLTQLQGAQKALNQKTGKDVTLPSPTAPVKPAKVPSPSDPVDASRLGESPLKAPTVTSTQSLGLQDYIASINEGNKATQKEADKLQKEQTKAKSAISSIYDKLTNSGQRAEEIYKQEGVDTARRQVDEYTNQLEAEQLANTRRQQELDKNVEGLFGGALAAAKDKANRESLSKQADLAILQNAAVRKYDTASAIAQRKIDLELEPLKTQLDALKFFYTENKAELSTKEQRLYESKIQADTMAYEEAKTSATTLQNTKLQLLQQAASQGADSSILNAIQGASTPEEAISAAGQYAGDILDRQYKQAQIANIQSEIAARGAESAGYDPSEILAFAQQYASTGQVPTGLPKGSFGIVSQVAMETPKPAGTLVDRNTGVKSSSVSAAQVDGIVALKDLTEKLTELSELRSQSGTLPKIFAGIPTQSRQQYETLQNEIVDLLARARTGAAITAFEEQQYLKKLPTFRILETYPQTKISGLKSSLEGKLNTTLSANNLSIYGYSTVDLGGDKYKVGDVVSNDTGSYRINPNGTLTQIQ